MHETVLLKYCPCLLERYALHAIQNLIGYFGAAIWKTIAVPVGRVLDHIITGKESLLRRRTRGRCRNETQTPDRVRNTLKCSLHYLICANVHRQALLGSNQL